MKRAILSVILLFFTLISIKTYSKTYNVSDFGAVNDGITLNTQYIQKAIDQCSNDGGGTVLFSGGGKYLTGTIYLKDNVTVYIENGTTLLGSRKYSDYATDTYKNMYKNESHMDRCLIFARDASSIAIRGNGTIDGNGHRSDTVFFKERPMLIRFMNCKNIHLTDITIINPASWTSAWLYCDDITVTGVKFYSRVNGNGDALNFDGCTRIRVSNCSFDNSDDCICLQASRTDKPCQDIVISNCIFTSRFAGIRIGLLSRGNFSSVTVTNCIFRNTNDSGLKIQMNEGGEMKNMVFSNLVMENVPRPIFMTFCQQRACVDAPLELAPMNAMHHFMFQNIIIDNSELDKNSAIFITGLPDKSIEEILIKDIQFVISGGGTKEDANKSVKEYTPDVLKGWWPEFHLVGTLPAYGIFARHVNGLTIENVNIKTLIPDNRVAIKYVNVKDLSQLNVYTNGKKISNKRKRIKM
jgi:polygalacturonase